MKQISDEQMEDALALLVQAATYEGSEGFGVGIALGLNGQPGDPTIKQVFDNYNALPVGHPLREQFEKEDVGFGYRRLRELNCKPGDRPAKLKAVMCIP